MKHRDTPLLFKGAVAPFAFHLWRKWPIKDQRKVQAEDFVRSECLLSSLLRRIKVITLVMLVHFDIGEPSEYTTVVANRVEESRLQRQHTCLGLASQGRLQLKHEEMTRELLGREGARCRTA